MGRVLLRNLWLKTPKAMGCWGKKLGDGSTKIWLLKCLLLIFNLFYFGWISFAFESHGIFCLRCKDAVLYWQKRSPKLKCMRNMLEKCAVSSFLTCSLEWPVHLFLTKERRRCQSLEQNRSADVATQDQSQLRNHSVCQWLLLVNISSLGDVERP